MIHISALMRERGKSVATAAIGFSTIAFADEATTGSRTTNTGPAAMTDAEMDKVTAASTLFITICPPGRQVCNLTRSIEIGAPSNRSVGTP